MHTHTHTQSGVCLSCYYLYTDCGCFIMGVIRISYHQMAPFQGEHVAGTLTSERLLVNHRPTDKLTDNDERSTLSVARVYQCVCVCDWEGRSSTELSFHVIVCQSDLGWRRNFILRTLFVDLWRGLAGLVWLLYDVPWIENVRGLYIRVIKSA